ncbi:hypothetical protein MMC32_005494 [Xylographa parallela]|nr:hypothetical protein [Xylographa parallela]
MPLSTPGCVVEKTLREHDGCVEMPPHTEWISRYCNSHCDLHKNSKKACRVEEMDEPSRANPDGGDPCPTCEARRGARLDLLQIPYLAAGPVVATAETIEGIEAGIPLVEEASLEVKNAETRRERIDVEGKQKHKKKAKKLRKSQGVA